MTERQACSASDRQGSYFESCVWRARLSHSCHHTQEALQAQFSLYVHKGGKKHNFFIYFQECAHCVAIELFNFLTNVQDDTDYVRKTSNCPEYMLCYYIIKLLGYMHYDYAG